MNFFPDFNALWQQYKMKRHWQKVFFLNTPYFFGIKFLKISSELPILPEKKVHKKWWWWLKTANKYDKIQNSSEVNYVPQIYYFYFFLKNLLNDFSLSTFLYHNRYSVLISRSTKFKTFFLNDPKVRGVLFEKKIIFSSP